MRKKIRKVAPGFTLLELLVVLAIAMLLIVGATIGMNSLRNSVALDTNLRDVKVEIQNAQNEARNSFLADSTRESGSLTQRRLSVGMILNISTNSKSLTLAKRAVYFTPPANYDPVNLRNDIKSLKNSTTLNCATIGAVTFAGAPGTLSCDTAISRNILGMTFRTASAPLSGISSCKTTTDMNLFFTAGYGEAVLPISQSECQIMFENSGSPKGYRAVKITKDTGAVTTCGDYCPTTAVSVPKITPKATLIINPTGDPVE